MLLLCMSIQIKTQLTKEDAVELDKIATSQGKSRYKLVQEYVRAGMNNGVIVKEVKVEEAVDEDFPNRAPVLVGDEEKISGSEPGPQSNDKKSSIKPSSPSNKILHGLIKEETPQPSLGLSQLLTSRSKLRRP